MSRFLDRFPFPSFRTHAGRPEAFLQARLLVRIYYAFLLFASVGILPRWDPALAAEVSIDPLWPVQWVAWVSFPVAFAVIRTFFIASAFSAMVAPERRWARAIAAVGLLEFIALYTSALRLDVDWYVWVLTALVFAFLPDIPAGQEPSSAERERFLLIFWAAQAANLLTYSMAGIGKLIGAAVQLTAGQTHVLMPEAVARHVADRLMTTDTQSILGAWVIAHPGIAWPLSVGSVFLLLFAFGAAFRPWLHRPWGIGLILFHIANYLALGIGFSAHIFLNAILLIHSPFRNPSTSWREAIVALPPLGWLVGGRNATKV